MLTQTIRDALNTLKTSEEISEAWEHLRRLNKTLSANAVMSFGVGDVVKFEGRRNRTLHGVIKSINQTTVSVEVVDPFKGKTMWRVAGGMLTKLTTTT